MGQTWTLREKDNHRCWCWLSLDRLGWYNIPCFDKAHVLLTLPISTAFQLPGNSVGWRLVYWIPSPRSASFDVARRPGVCFFFLPEKKVARTQGKIWDPEIDNWLVVFNPSQHVRVISTNHPKVLLKKSMYFWKIPSEMNWDSAVAWQCLSQLRSKKAKRQRTSSRCTSRNLWPTQTPLDIAPTPLLFTSPTADRNVAPLSYKLVHVNPSKLTIYRVNGYVLYYCIYIIYRHVSGINPIISRSYLS